MTVLSADAALTNLLALTMAAAACAGAMKAYTSLSKAEVDALVAYVQSLKQ